MAKAHEELTHPEAWLRRLATEPDAYARLIRESGGMACASYRLARARCSVESASGTLPTLSDLHAAARLLASRVGRGVDLPIKSALAGGTDSSGLREVQSTGLRALRTTPPPVPSARPRRSPRKAERSRPSVPHQ